MENHQKSNEIVLTEEFLNICMCCGRKFDVKGVYDFYCSKECEDKDLNRIIKMVDEVYHPVDIMNEQLKKVAG